MCENYLTQSLHKYVADDKFTKEEMFSQPTSELLYMV